ncbi:hypothetical protein BST61_g5357 [Cercospora zeina]
MASTSFLPLGQGPRVIVYHQTHHGPDDGPPVSLLPLITNPTGVTHVIIAAIHINDRPEALTLNDTSPSHEKFNTLWGEVAWLQASGIKVLGMLGGFAKGSYERLDGDDPQRFESYYVPLRDMIREHRLDGLDLDIEEPTSLPGTCRLIDRLRSDFGPDFLITLAPVATALLPNQPHLSGPAFDYRLLEQMRGHEIAWYNTQFYCGWGDASSTAWYDAIMSHRYCKLFAQGGSERPWEWAANMSRTLRTPSLITPPPLPVRPFGIPESLPGPKHNFPAESISTLKDLGFSERQAIAALNSTNGNVEYAAGLLFQD